jgi:hypothetical protein
LEPNSGEGRTTRLIFHPAAADGSPAAGFLLDDSTMVVSFPPAAQPGASARHPSVVNAPIISNPCAGRGNRLFSEKESPFGESWGGRAGMPFRAREFQAVCRAMVKAGDDCRERRAVVQAE